MMQELRTPAHETSPVDPAAVDHLSSVLVMLRLTLQRNPASPLRDSVAGVRGYATAGQQPHLPAAPQLHAQGEGAGDWQQEQHVPGPMRQAAARDKVSNPSMMAYVFWFRLKLFFLYMPGSSKE